MSRPFEFPRKPAMRRDDPFVGQDGKNPFADPPVADSPVADSPVADSPIADSPGPSASPAGEASSAPVAGPAVGPTDASGENLFAAPSESASSRRRPAYQPYGYETTLPHRGGLVLALGIVGLVLSLLGGLGGLAGWSGSFDMQSTLFLFGLAPLSFLSLGSSLPACILASHDLSAMQAGAMDAAGKTRTRVGYWLGLCSMLTSGAMAAIVIWGIIWLIVAGMA
jgi:hypothetical protein